MFDRHDGTGTLRTSGDSVSENRPALEVPGGDIKPETTNNKVSEKATSPVNLDTVIDVDNRKLVSPPGSRLILINTDRTFNYTPNVVRHNNEWKALATLRFIQAAVANTTDSDETIVSRAKILLKSRP